jgi:hypothetical protein
MRPAVGDVEHVARLLRALQQPPLPCRLTRPCFCQLSGAFLSVERGVLTYCSISKPVSAARPQPLQRMLGREHSIAGWSQKPALASVHQRVVSSEDAGACTRIHQDLIRTGELKERVLCAPAPP